MPISRGSRWDIPQPGTTPTRAWVSANRAAVEAIRKSHMSAISKPPVMAKPLTAPMIGTSIASIGKLDVTLPETPVSATATIAVAGSANDLRMVIKRFAERAFASTLTENEMAPYYQVGLDHFGERKDFVAAAKVGLKSIITSHRFLIAPGAHKNQSQQTAADLARTLWLSVPDPQLSEQANADTQHDQRLGDGLGAALGALGDG